jgi:hypothetical protein
LSGTVLTPNKQLQRTVLRRRGRGSVRPLNCGVMRLSNAPQGALFVLAGALAACSQGTSLRQPLMARALSFEQVHFRIKRDLPFLSAEGWGFYACGDIVLVTDTAMTDGIHNYYDRQSGRLLATCGCMFTGDCSACKNVQMDWPCQLPAD